MYFILFNFTMLIVSTFMYGIICCFFLIQISDNRNLIGCMQISDFFPMVGDFLCCI